MPSATAAFLARKQAFEKASKPTFTVISFKASVGNSDPQVDEQTHPNKVRYASPFFYADAIVKCVIPGTANYDVGFIQHCTSIDLTHYYESNNYTKWEYPTPISDSDVDNGIPTFPWYWVGQPGQRIPGIPQLGKGKVTIAGPLADQSASVVKLSMNDNLGSNVQWWDPVPQDNFQSLAATPHQLRSIVRKQSFTTWLVAKPSGPRTDFSVLHVVTWTMDFSIDFNCGLAKGQRHQASTTNNAINTNRAGMPGDTIPSLSSGTQTANDIQKLGAYDGQGQRLRDIALNSW